MAETGMNDVDGGGYGQWLRRGRPTGPGHIRTTRAPNAHRIPPIAEVELVSVKGSGSAVVIYKNRCGILGPGEWYWKHSEKQEGLGI